MDLVEFLVKTSTIVVVFGLTLVIAMYSTWAERKVAGFIQDRSGPNRAGWGYCNRWRMRGKCFSKKTLSPHLANKWLFIAGPSLAMLTALLASAVIPFGSTFRIAGPRSGIARCGI